MQYEQTGSEKGSVLLVAVLDRLEGSTELAVSEVPDRHFDQEQDAQQVPDRLLAQFHLRPVGVLPIQEKLGDG